jgi:hypothetical protein
MRESRLSTISLIESLASHFRGNDGSRNANSKACQKLFTTKRHSGRACSKAIRNPAVYPHTTPLKRGSRSRYALLHLAGMTECDKLILDILGGAQMLIRNYGLFWRKDRVHFGAGKNAGHLKGVLASATTAEPVDFREQQGVYCLYDENFRLVYTGQAGGKNDQRIFERLKQHRNDALSERWAKFSWFGVNHVIGSERKYSLKAEKSTVKVTISDALNHIEGILIAAAEPVHNRQGGRFGEDVQQYLQYQDLVNLPLSQEDGIKAVLNDLHQLKRKLSIKE